jgi:hypothetical protein
MEKERRGIRFGVVAVEKGFITSDQLMEALKIQVEDNLKSAEHRLIGMILMDMGLLTLEQIDEVLQDLG